MKNLAELMKNLSIKDRKVKLLNPFGLSCIRGGDGEDDSDTHMDWED